MEDRIDYLYRQTIEEFEPLYYSENSTHYDNEDNIDYKYYY